MKTTLNLPPEMRLLRDSLLSRLPADGDMPRVRRTATLLYQCLIRRTLDQVDGLRLAWEAGNALTAAIMARALIETAAWMYDLTKRLGELLEAGDPEAIDDMLRRLSTATRMKVLEPFGKSTNIVTLVDKLGRDLQAELLALGFFVHDDEGGEVHAPSLMVAYELLSEFAHPNPFGIWLLYSHLDEAGTPEFGTNSFYQRQLLEHSEGLLTLIPLIYSWCQTFDEVYAPRLSILFH